MVEPDPWMEQNETRRRMRVWTFLKNVLCDLHTNGVQVIFEAFFSSVSTKRPLSGGQDSFFYEVAVEIQHWLFTNRDRSRSGGETAEECCSRWCIMMQRSSFEDLEELRDTVSAEIIPRVFVLKRLKEDSEKTRKHLWTVLVSQIAARLREILKSAASLHLLKVWGRPRRTAYPGIPKYDAVVGWADEMLAEICSSAVMKEYVWAKNCEHGDGPMLLNGKTDRLPIWDTARVLTEILFSKNKDYKLKLREACDDGVYVLKGDADHSYHDTFERYASSSPTCRRFQGFNVSGSSSQGRRVVVYLKGFLVG